jgi:hypothetical protein
MVTARMPLYPSQCRPAWPSIVAGGGFSPSGACNHHPAGHGRCFALILQCPPLLPVQQPAPPLMLSHAFKRAAVQHDTKGPVAEPSHTLLLAGAQAPPICPGPTNFTLSTPSPCSASFAAVAAASSPSSAVTRAFKRAAVSRATCASVADLAASRIAAPALLCCSAAIKPPSSAAASVSACADHKLGHRF